MLGVVYVDDESLLNKLWWKLLTFKKLQSEYKMITEAKVSPNIPDAFDELHPQFGKYMKDDEITTFSRKKIPHRIKSCHCGVLYRGFVFRPQICPTPIIVFN